MLITEETAKESKTNQRLSSIAIAILVHAVIIGGATLLVILPNARKEPEIVAAVIAPPTKNEVKIEKKQIVKLAKETSSSSAASPIANMIRSSAVASISVPQVTKFSDGPLGLGEGDLGSGFGTSGSGGGLGSGATLFGSASGSGLVGRFYDLKQSRKGGSSGVRAQDTDTYGRLMRKLVSKNVKSSTFNDFYKASTELRYTFLAIPETPAGEGPAAFNVEKEVRPRGWLVHYTGTVNPALNGTWRFAGIFDDALFVYVNDELVFDGSLHGFLNDSSVRKEFGGPKLVREKAVAGKWFNVSGPFKIDIIIGECPGGSLGGSLMVQKRGKRYKERGDGSPILPVFTNRKLDRETIKKLRDYPYELDTKTPVFEVISTL